MNSSSSTGSIKMDGNGMTISSPTGSIQMNGGGMNITSPAGNTTMNGGNVTMSSRNIDITGSSGSRVKVTRTANGGTKTEITSSGGRSIVTNSSFGGGDSSTISVNGRQIITGENGTHIVDVGPDTVVGTQHEGMTGRVRDVIADTVVQTSFLLFLGGLVGAVLVFSLR